MATPFEISEYAEDIHKVSVASGPCQWTKKARQNEDMPVAVTELNTAQPGAVPKVAPIVDSYDPCPGTSVNVTDFFVGMKFIYPDANILLNRFKHEELHISNIVTCNILSMLEKAEAFTLKNESKSVSDFFKYIEMSISDTKQVEQSTRGHNDNDLWSKYRKGMITASNFKRVFTLRETTDPENLIKHLIGTNSREFNLPAALDWGRKKEKVSRDMFLRIHRLEHRNVEFEEKGLVIDGKHSYLGASV